MNSMRDYPPEMYNEILKDAQFRYGKFNPNPYPNITELRNKMKKVINNEEGN